MTNRHDTDTGAFDPIKFTETMSQVAMESQRLVAAFLMRQGQSAPGMGDPLNIGGAFMELANRMMADPAKLAQAQMALWQDYARLWQHAAAKMLGHDTAPIAEADPGDRRFKDEAWQDNAVFDFIKQGYLLTADWLQQTVGGVDGLDDKTARKVAFYTRQFADAIAPTNFLATNPEALRETVDTRGENLVRGLRNLLDDMDSGDGDLRIRMTDTDAFKVGENLAVTPGKVVHRTDLMELIQYDPTTEQVFQRPLLVVPPWINKYYILDLRPKNSFVKWATDQGYTVFIISWVNPDANLADKTFDDYLTEGTLAALDAIEQATGEREVAVAALCLGGTLLASTLGYLAAVDDDRIKSALFMATLTDFAEPGELSVFIDEEQIAALEQRMADSGGVLEGRDMATTFNMLRANDLIWSFVVHNYLMGKDPVPWDLLFWNSDSTRMPAAMHSFYLRNMYGRNLLREPGGIELLGKPIDLGAVKTPTYVMAAKEDHIAPWKSCYATTGIFGGPVRFVLAGSGHIAGVVNPPGGGKYPHWTNGRLAKTPDTWLEAAKKHDGSWWPDWLKWNAKHAGDKVPARHPGDGGLKVLEPAPGSYVQSRAD